MGLLAHHDGVLEAEVEDDLGVDHPVARLVEGVLDVGVQEVQRLPRSINMFGWKERQKKKKHLSLLACE